MDLPILGTIDLTPSGLFLFFAAVLAVGYFGWQLFGTGRAGRDAKASDEAPHVEEGHGDADEPIAEIDKDERPKD
ncbi:hypothetical protein [Demequina sp.]|uniref:hypothetical protein n=1 Tax=Demequina sp. TaxID=2050685 RepID=UPI0025BCB60A|nr:hypothetical protein [Demequina sp.]